MQSRSPGHIPGLEAPSWFEAALAHQAHTSDLKAAATTLRTAAWNPHEVAKPVLLLVHGFLAELHWWDAIAPVLSRHFRVFAFDFSGMGDSAHRREYTHAQWSDEVVAVARSLAPAKVHLVGHSFGGARALQACARQPECFAQLILVDSYLHFGIPTPVRQGAWSMTTQPRLDIDLGTTLARYRLVPDEPAPDFALKHAARHAVRSYPAGWGWKFDPKVLSQPRLHEDARPMLRSLELPVSLIYGERSTVVRKSQVETMQNKEFALRCCESIPDAGHHLPLTHPLKLSRALEEILSNP